MWRVKADVQRAVIADLAEQFQSREAFSLGGPEFARDVLEHLLGPERAEEIVGQLMAQSELRPFDFLRRTPPEQIVTFLVDEAPQTVALVVASLATPLGAKVLADLPTELQAAVAVRIATMGDINPGVVEDVERGLRQKLANVVNQEAVTVAIDHTFMICAVVLFVAAGVVWLSPRPRPPGGPPSAAH